MGYKLLGIVTWKGAKWFLRRKYGPTLLPKPIVAGGLVAIVIGVLVLLGKRDSGAA